MREQEASFQEEIIGNSLENNSHRILAKDQILSKHFVLFNLHTNPMRWSRCYSQHDRCGDWYSEGVCNLPLIRQLVYDGVWVWTSFVCIYSSSRQSPSPSSDAHQLHDFRQVTFLRLSLLKYKAVHIFTSWSWSEGGRRDFIHTWPRRVPAWIRNLIKSPFSSTSLLSFLWQPLPQELPER